MPPNVQLWRSVRATGDTKTKSSRRTVRLPIRCVEALTAHQASQSAVRERAGDGWEDNDLVFASWHGRQLGAANVRRGFKRVLVEAG